MRKKRNTVGQVPTGEFPLPTTLPDECRCMVAHVHNETVPPPVDTLIGRDSGQTVHTTHIHGPQILALVSIVAMLVFGYWWGQTVKPVGMIRAQLQAIEDGEYRKAYGYLSARAKEQVSYEEFVRLIQENSVVMEPRDSTFLSRKVDGTIAVITGSLEGYGGYVSEVEYVLVKEANEWRIATFEWDIPQPMAHGTEASKE